MVLWGTLEELVILQVLTEALEDQHERVASDGARLAVVTCEVTATHTSRCGRPETGQADSGSSRERTGWTHWRGSSRQKLRSLMDPEGKRECGMNWEIGIDIYTLLTLCIK